MYLSSVHKFHVLTSVSATSFLLSLLSVIGLISPSIAGNKQPLPVCQPPDPGEHLVLVISNFKHNRSQLRRILPAKTNILVCKYIQNTVIRVGGFRKVENANRWARYVKDSTGLSTIISTRPKGNSQFKIDNDESGILHQLGHGYAVLVDYLKHPEMLELIYRIMGGDVCFASYGKRSYLLAVYTNSQTDAYQTLKKLGGHGLIASIVDSRKVLLPHSCCQFIIPGGF
ncbi:hypothetical protein RINTHH_5190 [Richelia intracellularis HH01]|uniref:Uncharacterized protein n=1 Tax=Richelia intracellularis HH01 TaxID=1165094 RepID=M1WR16_9NOST|nr:hypothetical protein [Richelia intracellularis]CCH66674.1 hypothetical protein RINTHH_5190 [Richelia intracellularis HH01]HAE05350.1 hypothetical protein [Richelia sp.]